MDIKITGNAEKALKELRKQFPEATKKAMYTGGLIVKKIAKECLRSQGPVKLQPIANETRQIRKAMGQLGRGLGGILAERMLSFTSRGKIYSGWPSGLLATGEELQTSSTHERDKYELHRLHTLGIQHPSRTYSRPSRNLWGNLIDVPAVWKRIVDGIVKSVKARVEKATRH
jgi:hypothetical protein